MENRGIILGSLVLISVILASLVLYKQNEFTVTPETSSEHFDGTGWSNQNGPNWFVKQHYNPADWLVYTYPERIQPSCVSYDVGAKYGSLENLNYLSNASRFWRF